MMIGLPIILYHTFRTRTLTERGGGGRLPEFFLNANVSGALLLHLRTKRRRLAENGGGGGSYSLDAALNLVDIYLFISSRYEIILSRLEAS